MLLGTSLRAELLVQVLHGHELLESFALGTICLESGRDQVYDLLSLHVYRAPRIISVDFIDDGIEDVNLVKTSLDELLDEGDAVLR